jgi:hypothetical protein
MDESIRSGKFYDPDPGPDRIQKMTISDEDLYNKGLHKIEESYPEMPSARYRERVDDEKETSLIIHCDKGSLCLAGKLKASQFRVWCLDRLSQIIKALKELQPNIPEYIQTCGLADTSEMAKFSISQRKLVIEIISLLLSLKKEPGIGYRSLSSSPLKLAEVMEQFMRVRIPFECQNPTCDEEGNFICANCGNTEFIIKSKDERPQIGCRSCRRPLWTRIPPLNFQCERGHIISYDEEDLDENMELLPSNELLQKIADIINHHIRVIQFDPDKESFVIHGTNLLYYKDKSEIVTGNDRINITVNQSSNDSSGITGVNIYNK